MGARSTVTYSTLSDMLNQNNMHLLSELYSSRHPASTQDALTTMIYTETGIELPKVRNLTEEDVAALNRFETTYFATIMDMLENDIVASRGLKYANKVQKELDARYVFWLSAFILGVGFLYIFSITWLPIPETNLRIADTITGVFIGSIIVTIINYFYNKDRSMSNDNTQQVSVDKSTQSSTYTKQPYTVEEETEDDPTVCKEE